jgi:c-di-GMP-binding flagellar brake protein YcgR
MAVSGGAEDKRRHPRHAVTKKITARTGGASEDEIDALLRDVSAGGAAISGAFNLNDDDPIELEIEDVGVFDAEVTRSFDDGIGVRFVDIDEIEEEQLLSDLSDLDAQIRTDEI